MAAGMGLSPNDTSTGKINGICATDDEIRNSLAADRRLRLTPEHWLAKSLGTTEWVKKAAAPAGTIVNASNLHTI